MKIWKLIKLASLANQPEAEDKDKRAMLHLPVDSSQLEPEFWFKPDLRLTKLQLGTNVKLWTVTLVLPLMWSTKLFCKNTFREFLPTIWYYLVPSPPPTPSNFKPSFTFLLKCDCFNNFYSLLVRAMYITKL
jgi:hypothetical protein